MLGKTLTRCTMAAVVALIGHGLSACGDDGDGDGNGGGGPAADCATNTLTYQNYGAPLFAQHCISCHGATPIGNSLRLDSLPAIKAETAEIVARTVDLSEEPTMPFGQDPLPAAEREKLEQWLECGAPP